MSVGGQRSAAAVRSPGPALLVERAGSGFEALLVALPILLIIYIPKPPFEGAQFLVFPMIGAVVTLLGLLLLTFSNWRMSSSILALGAGLMVLATTTAWSEISNATHIRYGSFLTAFKPVLHLLLLVLGALVADRVTLASVKAGMWVASLAILAGQTLLVVGQILGLQVLDLVYSEEKVRGIGGILRSTGSLGNPNVLGMVVVLAVLLYLGSGVRAGRWAAILAAGVLVVFSGSRTMLVLLPLAILCHSVLQRFLQRTGRPFPLGRIAFLAAGLLAVSLSAIYVFSDFFSYQAQLLVVISTGDLGAVSSMAQRFAYWDSTWDTFLADPSSTKWWFGLGSRPEYRVADNDWFYTIWRTGLLGLVVQLGVHLMALSLIDRVPNPQMRTVCFAFFFCLLIVSWQYETMSTWFYPMLYFYLIGLASGHRTLDAKSVAPYRTVAASA